MSAMNKMKRRIADAIAGWESYIAYGSCKSYDEYVKSVATLRTYKALLRDIDEAESEELNEGSDHAESA